MAEEVTHKRTKIWTMVWIIVGIVISWTTFWFFLFSPFGLLAWIAILIYLIIKKSTVKWYLILSAWLLVPCISFLTGTVSYFMGTASLQGVGGPETYHGIDRETRVPSTSSGCIFVGFEPFVFPANNLAVELCTNLFGYQRGAYTGIFPTEEEAKEIMKIADTLTVQRMNKYYRFQKTEPQVEFDTADFYRFHDYTSLDTVVGKSLNNECFLFQPVGENDLGKAIYLVDIKGNALIAQYFNY